MACITMTVVYRAVRVFVCVPQVRNDEWEHVKTMKALQEDVASER